MSVFVNNIDDFIGPTQACVNPFISESRKKAASGSAKITLQADLSVSEFSSLPSYKPPDLIKSKTSSASKTVATVSLNDCLACR